MNLFSFLRPGNRAPMKPATEPALPIPPFEPSCYAKGLAKSLREDGEDVWVSKDDEGDYYDEVLIHQNLDVTVSMRWARRHYEMGDFRNSDLVLTDCSWLRCASATGIASREEPLIAQALEARPRGRFKKHIEDVKAKEEATCRAQDHFTKLGCP